MAEVADIYLRRYSRPMAGMVEMSPQTQPQTQMIKAKNDRTGLSHSKQDLQR